MGGSLGAKLITTTMPKVFGKLSQEFPEFKFFVSHQCGRGNLEETKSHYDLIDRVFDLSLFEFEESMENFIQMLILLSQDLELYQFQKFVRLKILQFLYL